MSDMEFGILGPLEVHTERGKVAVAGGKPAAVLAVLLLHPNEPVSVDKLAIALWGEDVPGGASRTVRVHVSRLRKALGNPEILITTPSGYRLVVKPDELDAARFEELVRSGRQTLANGEAEEASEVLREALTLWRGPPLADFAAEPFAPAEIARLEEQRLEAVEMRLEADLAAGRHRDVVAELQHLVAEHPTREKLAEHLMLALYRCGRQAEALEAYREAHRVLLDEIGVEPRAQLRDLQAAILRQDPALDPPAPTELPTELDPLTATPLVGRDDGLAVLRERWDATGAGRGAVLAITGGRGSGKTRIAAELAGAVHRRGAAVLSANGNGRALFDAVAHAREAHGPTLLVLDNADEAPAEVRGELRGQLRAAADRQVLVLVTGDDEEALADFGADETVVLEPLNLAAVREIAMLYAPAHAADGTPDEWLLNVSGGVPRRVHEIAGDWARREAARRVSAVAGRAAAGRADLRSIESELADNVEALEAARERVDRIGDAQDEPVMCPFKGLASFEVADAPYFFGREQLVAQLVARLVGAPMLGVIGPSGSGKSSVVQAGLLPALARGVLPGSKHWRQVVLRPGEHPLQAMTALAEISEGERFVLAVDQFEEVFTVCRDESQRARFIDELVRLSRRNAAVVVAIRADQYGRCADYPELSDLLAANQVLVGAMGRDDLLRAVEYPAERAGLRVEPALSRALVDDVQGEPGALPLLSTALLELWQQRDGRRLSKAAYERTGGVQGAVGRLGEDAFRALDAEQQQTARHVLMALVAESSTGTVERRRVPLHELEIERSEDVRGVVEVLADRRLLTLSEGSVEVAHEALLREWPRLRSWIDEDRQRIRIHRSLHAAAADWVAHDRNDDWLYRGSHLLEARELDERGALGLTGDEREFLAASDAYALRDRTARRRRVAIAFGALALGLVVICVVALVAIHQRRDADRQRNLALSRALAVQSAQTLNADPDLALRLALWADETTPTAESAAALRQATAAFRQLAKMPADAIAAQTAAFSPDGNRVVTGGDEGVARVWDPARERELAKLRGGHEALQSARYSPDGARLALGFADGTVLVTDDMLRAPNEVLNVKDASVNRVAFSKDGTRVAAALSDGTVHVVGVDSGSDLTIGTATFVPVYGVDMDAAGRVVTADENGDVKLWRADGSGAEVLGKAGAPERDVDFSADGRLILAVGEDHAARLWNARTGRSVADVSTGPRKLASAAFSRDGRRFATASYDGAVRVWTTAGQSELFELRGHLSRVLDVGFGPTSDRLVSAGNDGTARVWDASGIEAFHGPTELTNASYSPSGRWIATGGNDGAVRLWDPSTGALRRTLKGPEGYTPAYFSGVSDDLAIGRDATSTVLRLQPSERRPRFVARFAPGSGVNVAQFDPTGKRFVYADYAHGTIRIRDLDSGQTTQLRGGPGYVVDAQASPDGRQAAAAGKDGVLYIWDLAHPGRPVHRWRGHAGHINTLDYSADGRIVTAGTDRTARIWNPNTGASLVLRGHTDEVNAALFTADGTRVLTASADGTVRLWDARSGHELVTLESSPDVPLYDVSEGPGAMLATLDDHQVVRIFRCTVCGTIEQVRAAALALHPRALTEAERRRFSAGIG